MGGVPHRDPDIFQALRATALIDDNGFSSLNYRPAGSEVSALDPLEAELAEVAAMFRLGIMIDRQRLDVIIDQLRYGKAENPALAVIAAHICFRIGDFEQIGRHGEMANRRRCLHAIRFATFDGKTKPAANRTLVGDLPIMSPAWGLLPTAEFEVDNRVKAAAGGVALSLWTMVNAAAGQKLAEHLQSAEVPALPTGASRWHRKSRWNRKSRWD